MAAAELNQSRGTSNMRGEEVERNQREEMKGCDSVWARRRRRLMVPCQYHYVCVCACVLRSGFTPDGRDIHIQARVRRPPTLDTGRAPGPDTWSVVRRQVRQETDRCLLATCQSRLATPPPPPPPPPPSVMRTRTANHSRFSPTQLRGTNLLRLDFMATGCRVKRQESDLL